MKTFEFDISELKAWSGYYIDSDKLKCSASGGGATALAEGFIKSKKGYVFGVVFSSDFRVIEYTYTENVRDLHAFQGSKYASSKKILNQNGKVKSVFEVIADKLKVGRYVLMIGLGCDIAALYMYLKNRSVDCRCLYTVELICSGSTYGEVQNQYIENIERVYHAKVVDFSMRYKKCGWTPFYIYIKLDNGKEHIRTFYDSDYGYAFQHYKLRKCYSCQYRGEKHPADIAIGDYWGIHSGMDGFCQDGVSVFLVKTKKGLELMDSIDVSQFCLVETDKVFAIKNNPMYYNVAIDNGKWKKFDAIFKKDGLRAAVVQTSNIDINSKVFLSKNSEIVLWGTGKCFYENFSRVREICNIRYICDNDKNKWNKQILEELVCISPQELKKMKDVFVVIMIENIQYAFQVVHQLLGLGISNFDIVYNWLQYANGTFSRGQRQ